MNPVDTAVSIRLATPEELPQLAITLVSAFLDTPDAEYLVPDRGERREVYQRFCAGLLGPAIKAGWVHTTADGVGVAIWQPPETPPPDLAAYDAFLNEACGSYADEFRVLDELFARHRPTERHHLLDHLAVLPPRQGRGLGSALLRHHHARFDAAGEPSFLIAVSFAARRLYERHGYVATADFELPDMTPMWAMWREPRGGQPQTSPVDTGQEPLA
jgi:GNAT superfamily N-acetyltransferase